MRRICETLKEHDVKATVYVLGWLARRKPQLLRAINAAGHEIGSHSYWHRQVFRLTPTQFRADLRRSQRVIEDAIGKPVTTYRAPSFSITKRSLWALNVLAEEGITTDSSVYPVRHDRYGIPGAPLTLHKIATSAGTLWEMPPAVYGVGRMRFPVGGGGYFRLYPWQWTRVALQRINNAGCAFACYFHPWEFDPDQPRLNAGGWTSRRRHYANLHTTHEKFRRLLASFSFGRIADVVAAQACLPDAATVAA